MARFKRFKALMGKSWWTHIFRAVTLLSFMTAIMVYYQQRTFIHCIAEYNDAQAKTAVQRTEANQDNFRAIDQLVKDFFNAKTAKAQQTAGKKYLEAREAAEAKRKASPPPASPSERCD